MLEKKLLNPTIIIPLFIVIILNITIYFVHFMYVENNKKLAYTQAFKSLQNINNIKHHKLQTFFDYRKGDIETLANEHSILTISNQINKNTSNPNKEIPYLDSFIKNNIYSNVLLLDASHGNIIFSVTDKKLIGKNINSPLFENSKIKELWNKTLKRQISLVGDMEYSNILTNDNPYMLFATPVKKDSKVISILMLQVASSVINSICSLKEESSETLETYLVGDDKLLRSNSYLKHDFNVKNSFVNPSKYYINLDTSNTIRSKNSYNIYKDHRGVNVLSVQKSFNSDSLNWTIISKIDESELEMYYIKTSNEVLVTIFLLMVIITILVHFLILRILDKTVIYPLEVSCKTANNFKQLIENSKNEIFVFKKDTLKFSYANKKAIKNIGHSLNELKNMTPVDIKPQIDEKMFNKIVEPLINKQKDQMFFDTIHSRKDGTVYDVEIDLQLMDIDDEEQFVAFIVDITQKNDALKEKEFYYKKATHDHLTKIYNRQMFDLMFDKQIEEFKRYNKLFSIILFDIDNFKKINDTYGHDNGDKVLVKLSENVAKLIRESDIFARWGGEEFVVLMKSSNIDQAYNKAEEIRKNIESTILVQSVGKLTCSFGVTSVTDKINPRKAFKEADNALYLAKRNGKNIVEKS